MTDNMRTILQTLGRLLLEIAGEEQTATVDKTSTVAPEQPAPAEDPQPAPQPEAPKKKRQGQRPVKDYACIVCGSPFRSSGNHPLLCPHCRILRINGNKEFWQKFEAAKARLAKRDDPSPVDPAPAGDNSAPTKPGKLYCKRLHGEVDPSRCGNDKALCNHCPQRSDA